MLKGNGTAISAAVAGTDYQAALTGTGLVVSSGGTISYVTNNSTNWDTAYSQRLSSLTTTGNSGAATLIGNVLNIPNYTAAGIGAIASTRTIATTTPLQGGGDLSADRTLSILQATTSQSGYLSSTDWTTFNNKQAALSGTGIVKSTAGTISYLTDNSANWDSAFGWGNHASAGYLTSATAASTYVPQTRNLTIDGVTQNLTADRTFTINKTLNDLTDVTITSVAGGDLLQYSLATSQWINTPLSAITSVGADNGLSFSGGNVILGGELDFVTTINTYNTVTPAQHSLTFTAGSTAFTSPGTAPIRITETTAYSAGRAAFYVGANDNHAILVEGKGAPVTTAPTYTYERSSANLLKNSTIHSKAKQGLGLYTIVDSNETFSSVTRYNTPKIPAVLIEKNTGLITTSTVTAIGGGTTGDLFYQNQLFNLLTLRLSRSATTSNFGSNYGVEMSFESQYSNTGNILRFADLRAYKSGVGEGTSFSITTRSNLRLQEYTGLILSENGILTLPAYKTLYPIIKDQLAVSTSGGVIIAIGFVYSPNRPGIHYDDNATVVVEDPTLLGSGCVVSPTLGYSLKRIRITNPGSGYVTAPAVTISAPPTGGSGWVTGVQAVATSFINAAGEVEYIQVTNVGTRYVTLPTITIAPPPSGTTATAVAEFGQGEVLFITVVNGGSNYSNLTRAAITTQTYSNSFADAFLGVDSAGKVIKSNLSLDYLINGSNGLAPFGVGGFILHNTQLYLAGYSFDISSAKEITLTAGTGGDALKTGKILLSTTSSTSGANNRVYRILEPDISYTSYFSGEAANIVDLIEAVAPNPATSLLLQSAFSGLGTFESGGAFNYYAYNNTSERVVEIYASCSNDAQSQSGQYTGAKIGLYVLHDFNTSFFSLETKQINFDLTSTHWGTAGDTSVFTSHIHFLQQNNNTTTYDVELGSGYIFNASGYLEDAALAASGTYTADMLINTGSQEGFRGIELAVNSDFDPLNNATSKVQINTSSIYNELNSNVWITGATVDVYTQFTQSLQKLNYTTNYDTEAGGKYNLHTKGYYEEGAVIGDYNSIVNINSTSEGGSFRGIELIANSNFNPATGTVLDGESKIQITSKKIYILPDNIGTTGDVLSVTSNVTGELGYTTLAAVATSGDYNDLTSLPTIPVNLDDLADVSAASPTNGQVLSYNTGASAWQAVTFSASGLTLQTNNVTNANQSTLNLVQGTNITIVDSGTGTVTINSSGGSGGVGLDSVFMLMGA